MENSVQRTREDTFARLESCDEVFEAFDLDAFAQRIHRSLGHGGHGEGKERHPGSDAMKVLLLRAGILKDRNSKSSSRSSGKLSEIRDAGLTFFRSFNTKPQHGSLTSSVVELQDQPSKDRLPRLRHRVSPQ